MGRGGGGGAAGVLTDEGQDDGQQGRCGEGDGHVHLQHLQQVHCGHRAAAREGLGRAQPTPGRPGLTDEDEDLVVRVAQQHGHAESLRVRVRVRGGLEVGTPAQQAPQECQSCLFTHKDDHDDEGRQVGRARHPHADKAIMLPRHHIPQETWEKRL